MILFTKEINRKLEKQSTMDDSDKKVICKVFNPTGAATWYIVDQVDDPDILFAYCDLGLDTPEWGYVSRHELETVKGRMGLGMERDRYFTEILVSDFNELIEKGTISQL